MGLNKDFPAFPKNGVYLDSATIGLRPQLSIDAQHRFIEEIGSTIRLSIHSKSRKALDEYLETKSQIASLFNCDKEKIAFQINADLAWNLILMSLVETDKVVIFASIFDPHSIIAPLIILDGKGKIELKFLYSKTNLDLANELGSKVQQNSILVISSVSPLIAQTRDIAKLSTICRQSTSQIFVDYSRSAGQNLPDFKIDKPDISIIDSSIDLLGPEASTIMYIQKLEDLEFNFPGSGLISHIAEDEVGLNSTIEVFEVGSPNVAGIIGLKASLEYLAGLGYTKIANHNVEIQ